MQRLERCGNSLYFRNDASARRPFTNVSGRAIRQLRLPAITEPVIAIAAGMALVNSRLITAATQIAATGSTMSTFVLTWLSHTFDAPYLKIGFRSAKSWTRTWQWYGFSHRLPRRFGGVCGQRRTGCPYPVYKLRCGKAGRYFSEYVIENCPIGHLGQTRSGFLHRTGVFAARLITHAHFQEHQDDQRQPDNCSDDHHRYGFATAWGAIQVTNSTQKRFALHQDRVDAIPRSRSKQS
jgi:hypothetical protein